MTGEEIKVAVVFNARGQAELQRGAESLDRLAFRLNTISQRAGSSSRVLRVLENDLNRFSSVLRSRVSPAVNTFNNQFERMYSLAGRLTRYGFYALIAQFTAVGVSLQKLGKDFIRTNQQFAELEITLKSVYGSVRTARALRDEIARITIQSPLRFSDIANTIRSFSAMPMLSARIAQQAYQPGGFSNRNGFTQRAVEVVEQLTTFRPDKLAEDAVFAIREAITGEMRSLLRRFEFPPSLLVSASGQSLEELKRRPEAMLDAIKKAMDAIISPEAVREMARQPSKLFGNLVEQVYEIPLLRIGRIGEESGRSFYDRFLDFFYNVLEESGQYIETKFEPIAKRISEALNKMFDTIFLSDNSIVERLMTLAGIGKTDLPGLSLIERLFEGFARFAESGARNLPIAMDYLEKAVTTLVPILSKLTEMFLGLGKIFLDIFSNSPALGLLSVYGAVAAPSFVRGATGLFAETAMQKAQDSRLAFAKHFVNPNHAGTSVNNAISQSFSGATGQTFSATGRGGLLGTLTQQRVNGRFSGTAGTFGFDPNAVAYIPTGNSGFVNPRSAMGKAILGSGPGLGAQYGAIRDAAKLSGAGGFTSRVAGALGGAALSMGTSAGFASSLAVGTMTVASLATSVVLPILAIVAGTAIVGTITDKVSGYLSARAKAKNIEALAEKGITDQTLATSRSAFEVEALFLSNFLSTKKPVSNPNYPDLNKNFTAQDLGNFYMPTLSFDRKGKGQTIYSGQAGMALTTGPQLAAMFGTDAEGNIAKLAEARQKALEDREKLFSAFAENDGFNEVSLSSGIRIVNKAEATTAIDAINKYFEATTPLMKMYMDVGSKLSGVQIGKAFTPAEQEDVNKLERTFEQLSSVAGFIESVSAFQEISEKLNAYQTAPNMSALIESTQTVLTGLQTEQNPAFLLEEAFKGESERLTVLLDLRRKVGELSANGAFFLAGENASSELASAYADFAKMSEGKILPGFVKNLVGFITDPSKIQKLLNEVEKSLGVRANSAVDMLTANQLAPALATFQTTFADVGDMTKLYAERYRDAFIPQFKNILELADRSGNTGLANTIAEAFEGLSDIPEISASANAEEVELVKQARFRMFETFFSKMFKALEGMPTEYNSARELAKVAANSFGMLREDSEAQGARLRPITDMQYRTNLAGALSSLSVEGSGPAANALRDAREAAVKKYSSREQFPDFEEFLNVMRLDPTGMRGAENQVLQGKAQAQLFRQMADLEEARIRNNKLTTEELEKTLQLADHYNQLAASAERLVEQIEGKGNIVTSFAHGVGSVLSEWRASMQNFTDMGVTMTQNFAAGMGNALTSFIMKTKSAKEAFRDFALSFIEMAVQMMMQRAVMMLLGSAFGGAGVVAGTAAGAAFQNNSFVIPQGASRIQGRENGGILPGAPSNHDNMLIYAASGEYVIPSRVVQRYGKSHFDQYLTENFTSKVPQFYNGGMVTFEPQRFANGGMVRPTNGPVVAGAGTTNVPVNVKVEVHNDKGTVTTSSDAANQANMISRGIQIAIQEELIRQNRQGGIFKQRSR